jgi:hypothetical protein
VNRRIESGRTGINKSLSPSEKEALERKVHQTPELEALE